VIATFEGLNSHWPNAVLRRSAAAQTSLDSVISGTAKWTALCWRSLPLAQFATKSTRDRFVHPSVSITFRDVTPIQRACGKPISPLELTLEAR
jgi:hypothetical protein